MGDVRCTTGTIPQISMGWYEKIIVSTIMVEGVMQDATRMVRGLMYNGNDAGLLSLRWMTRETIQAPMLTPGMSQVPTKLVTGMIHTFC